MGRSAVVEHTSSMVYSEALRQQLALAEFWASSRGQDFRHSLVASNPGMPIEFKNFHERIWRVLVHGEPFFVSPAICDLLEASVVTYPSDMLRVTDVPCATGFVWFSHALPVSGTEEALCAVTWEIEWDSPRLVPPANGLTLRYVGERPTDDPDATPFGLRVQFWGRAEDWGIIPRGEAIWPFGDAWDNWDPVGQPRGHEPTIMQAHRKYLMAFLRFIGQPIVRTLAMPAHRSVQRRAPKDRTVPLVRVVRLRTTEHATHGHQGAPVDWSCQWIVRGHWRQQWYASTKRHQPKFIAPHVKGPEDKPLKPPRATVFAVVR